MKETIARSKFDLVKGMKRETTTEKPLIKEEEQQQEQKKEENEMEDEQKEKVEATLKKEEEKMEGSDEEDSSTSSTAEGSDEDTESDDDDDDSSSSSSSSCSSTISSDGEYNSEDSCSFTDSSDSETQANLARQYQEIYSLPHREKSRRSASKKKIDYSVYFDSDSEDGMQDEEEVVPVTRYDLIQQWTETRIEMVCNHAPESKVQDGVLIEESDDEKEEEEDEDSLEEGEEYLYLIKWSGLAHIHNTWHKMDELVGTKGYKRLQNYEKRRIEDKQWRHEATDEEIEQAKVMKELDLQIKHKWMLPERVIGRHPELEKMDDGTKQILYIVKWSYLPYNECTYETQTSIVNLGYENLIWDFENTRKRGGYPRNIIYHRPGMFKKMETQPSYINGGVLRDYQLEGVNWLHYSWARNTNIIMADEMGLGKTIQTISFLKTLYHKHHLKGPFLIVVPLSTISGWLKELKKWGKKMRFIAYIGNGDAREIMREFEFYDDRKRLKFSILLTTYEMIIKDEAHLGKIPWAHISVDEAHRLKNDANRLYQSLINFEHNGKLLITGTPLQNTLRELWCLLHFLEPNKFRDYPRFERKFGDLRDKEVIASLHKALEPHILRREKHDVEKSLPQKIETVLRVSLTTFQKEYYKWILTRNFKELNASGHATSLLNIVVDLKKVCNHPYLFVGAREQSEKDMENRSRLERIVASSGKMILLDKLLTHLSQNGHRVLIFSQMVRMLNLLSEYLSLKGFKHQRLDGNTSAQHRMQAVDHFNAPESDDFVFLLSTRAGGLGINLATADTVIIFDSDWNPQADLQAEARAHRIGQTKVVNIYRFVSKFSVEEKILEAARQKRILDHLVIQRMDTSGRVVLSGGGGRKKKSFTKEELSDVLKFGAEGLFDNASEEKHEESAMSIDDIIAAGERVKQPNRPQPEQNQESDNKSLMSFKVANFIPVGEKDEDLNKLSDAVKHAKKKRKRKRKGTGDESKDEFWQKLFPDLATNAMIDTLNEEAAAYHEGKRTRNLKRKNYADQGQLEDYINEHDRRKRIAHFTISQTRTFIEYFKQWPDPDRCNDICEMANIGRTGQEAAKLVRKLLAACRRGLTRKKVSNNKKTKFTSVIRFNGISIDAKEILRYTEQFEALQNTIHEFPKRETQINPRQVMKWPVKWTEEDDYELLQGILKHGIGNWDSIRTDPDFNLMQKICPAHSTAYKRARPSDIQRRVDTLLRVIESEYERVEDDDGDAYEDPESSEQPTRRSKRRARRKRIFKEIEMPHSDLPCAALLSAVEDEIEMMASIVTSLYEDDDLGNSLADQLPAVGDLINDIGEKGVDNSRKRASTIRRDLWNYVQSKIGVEENMQQVYETLKEELEDEMEDDDEMDDEDADDESEGSSSTRKRSSSSDDDEDPRPTRKKRLE